MYDNPGSDSPPVRRFGQLLLGPAALSLALLAFSADRGEAGLFGSPAIKKTVSTFAHGDHRITVWRYEPKAKGKHPALVMLHGLDCLGESPKRYEFIAERFAGRAPAVDAKWREIPHRIGSNGIPLIEGCAAWLECEVLEVHAAGDHDVCIGTVKLAQPGAGNPLVLWDRTFWTLQ